MDISLEEQFANPPAETRKRIRQAFATLFKLRVLYIALALGWAAQMFQPVLALGPEDFWMTALAGGVGVLAGLGSVAVNRRPLMTGLQVAMLSSIYLVLLDSYDALAVVAILLVVVAWICVAPLFKAQRGLSSDASSGQVMRRFEKSLRPIGPLHVNTAGRLALLLVMFLTIWRVVADHQSHTIPPTLQPSLNAFVVAWNQPGEEELRRVVSGAAKEAGAWKEFAQELRGREWNAKRPRIEKPPTVRGYGSQITVVYPFPGTELSMHWELSGETWELTFLYLK